MSQTTNPDLAVLKLQRELDKLAEEVGKLREDRRWYNRHLAGVVALCGVMATFGVGFAQFNSNNQRNNADSARAARDEKRRDIDTGLRLLEFSITRQKDFLSADPDGQVRFVRLVLASLPKDEAHRVLTAFAGVASQAQVLEELAASGIDISKTAPAGVTTYAIGPVLSTPPPPPTPGPTPTTTTTATTTPATTPATTAPPPPAALPAGSPLVVYAHVAEENDRGPARSIAMSLGPSFPLAGVEYVPAWGSRRRANGEVRYYKSDQRSAAEALALRLAADTRATTGMDIPFRAIDISRNYPNLPSNRIEVWFPQLPDR